MKKIKNMKLTFILTKIISLSSIIQKYFSKSLSEENVVKFRVNTLSTLQTMRESIDKNVKHLYSCESSKIRILMKDSVKITALLNSKAEINVMIQRFMRTTNLFMRIESRLRLISHTKHEMNFVEICRDVIIDIKEFVTYHHIFVIIHVDH